jgi:L-ascorbate metabolism protein UlaG (beta-lactamase superfamily)
VRLTTDRFASYGVNLTMPFPASDHFDGQRFHNKYHRGNRTFRDLIRWWRTRDSTKWPVSVPLSDHQPPPPSVSSGHAAITFIGHSTFLIRTAGAVVLTDPVFTACAGPYGRFGPRRVQPPGLALANLPNVDAVFVSHNHYDHLQPSSLLQLQAQFHPVFVTTLGLKGYLEKAGLRRVVELDWWKKTCVDPDVEVTCTPAQHFSARGMRDRNKTLWGGFAIRSGGLLIYFAGDSGYCPHFEEIRRQIGRIDIALLPIGAYKPRWFMKPMHMNPDEAMLAHLDLQARTSIAMHFGTFKLTDEGIDDPPRRLTAARAVMNVAAEDFRIPRAGETLLV